jgi:outer membrane protein OmpA-like peptidoglycan-associated protein
MPPIPSEQDIIAALPTAKAEASPPPAGNAQALRLEEHIGQAIDRMNSDGTALKSEVHQLRSHLARASASQKRTTIMTGILLVLAMLLMVADFKSVFRANANGMHAPAQPQPDNKPMAEMGAAMKQMQATLQGINERLDRQPVKQAETKPAAAVLNCANLPANIKTSSVDIPVQFDVGSAKLSPAAESMLDSIASILALAPERCVLVEGYSDASGKAEKNLELSRSRADSVVNYIAQKGNLGAKRLIPLGKGASKPATGLDPLDPKNRRVIFKVVVNY